MSVLFRTEQGVFISHQLFSENIFRKVSVGSEVVSMRLNSELFDIDTPFLRQNENIKVSQEKRHSRRKRKLDSDFLLKLDEMGTRVKGELRSIVQKGQKNGFISVKKEPYLSCTSSESDILAREKKDDINLVKDSMESDRNVKARSAAEDFYRSSWKKEVTHMHGQNSYDSVLMKEIPGDGSSKYLFPSRCEFHCCDVKDMEKHVKGSFDLVVLDPPWWNKYIRRKNAKCAEGGYQMMSNDDLGAVPVGNFLNPGALVAVWCTNSESNLETLEKKIFPQWGIEFIGRWFWIKVTKFGEPVCQFHPPPGKQPFEQIVFGRRRKDDDEEGDDIVVEWESNKVVASVPSALHSHKPPLVEVLQPYIKPDARCLELFARYLLPGWTSVGFEVLKLQNCSLYEEVK